MAHARRPTLLYTLGLEHTGHHLWESIVEGRTKIVSEYINLFELAGAQAMMKLPGKHGWDWNANRTEAVRGLTSRFGEETWRGRDAGNRGLSLVGINSCSYPCGFQENPDDPGDPLRYPIDPVAIAMAARAARLDVRFLVLWRPAGELFDNVKQYEVAMYAWACRQLRRHVEALVAYDPSLVMLLRYNDTDDGATQERLSGFLRTNASRLLHGKFRRTGKRWQRAAETRRRGLQDNAMWPMLDRCVKKIEQCTAVGDGAPNESCADRRTWQKLDPLVFGQFGSQTADGAPMGFTRRDGRGAGASSERASVATDAAALVTRGDEAGRFCAKHREGGPRNACHKYRDSLKARGLVNPDGSSAVHPGVDEILFCVQELEGTDRTVCHNLVRYLKSVGPRAKPPGKTPNAIAEDQLRQAGFEPGSLMQVRWPTADGADNPSRRGTTDRVQQLLKRAQRRRTQKLRATGAKPQLGSKAESLAFLEREQPRRQKRGERKKARRAAAASRVRPT